MYCYGHNYPGPQIIIIIIVIISQEIPSISFSEKLCF